MTTTESDDTRLDLVWRCAACGYQRQAPERPTQCAGCGADPDRLIGKTAIAWRFQLRHAAAPPGPALHHSPAS